MADSAQAERQALTDKRTVEQEFQEISELVRKKSKFPVNDYRGIVLKRRREAAVAWLPRVRERYGEAYPELNLPFLWAQECSAPGLTMAGMERFYHISLAAAIWILDVLDQTTELEEDGLRLLKPADGPESAGGIPYFHDPRFSREVVKAMVRLIRCRNGQTEPLESYLNKETAQYPENRSLSAEGLQDRDPGELTNAQRFRVLLSRVPVELAEQAARHFEEKMWEFLDAAFAGASFYQKKLKRIEQQRERLWEKLMDRREPCRRPTVLQLPSVPSAPAMQKEQDFRALDQIDDQCEALWDQLQNAFQHAHAVFEKHRWRPQEEKFLESISRILALEAEDPYELCFGFLYLVETGSSLPWLYNAPMGVLQMAVRQLPWTAFGGGSDYEEEDEEESWDEDLETPTVGDAETPAAAPGYLDWTEKKKDLYRLRYDDRPLYSPMESPFAQWKLNLPQLVYGMTNMLMPRNVHWFDETKEELAEAGMEPGLAAGMELYLQLASDCRYPIDFAEEEPQAQPPEPEQAEKEPEASDRETRAKLHQAREQVRSLQKQLTRQQDACRRLEEDKSRLRQQLEQTEAQCRSSLQRKNLKIAFLKRKISQPRAHEQIADWVKTTFRDRLVLHARAVDQLNDKSAKAVDVGLICDALDFLATDYWAQLFEGLTQAEVNRNCSEKYGRPFEIKATGEPTIAYTPSQYTLRYPDPATGKVTDRTMDFHLRVGNSPEKLLRIYFFHDKENRKIVVGSLPGHLRVIKLQ